MDGFVDLVALVDVSELAAPQEVVQAELVLAYLDVVWGLHFIDMLMVNELILVNDDLYLV